MKTIFYFLEKLAARTFIALGMSSGGAWLLASAFAVVCFLVVIFIGVGLLITKVASCGDSHRLEQIQKDSEKRQKEAEEKLQRTINESSNRKDEINRESDNRVKEIEANISQAESNTKNVKQVKKVTGSELDKLAEKEQ